MNPLLNKCVQKDTLTFTTPQHRSTSRFFSLCIFDRQFSSNLVIKDWSTYSNEASPGNFHKYGISVPAQDFLNQNLSLKKHERFTCTLKFEKNCAGRPPTSCLLWLHSHGFLSQGQEHGKVKEKEGKRDGENPRQKSTQTALPECLLHEAGHTLGPFSRMSSPHQHHLCT